MINYTAITDHVITVDSEADLQELLNGIDLTGITWDIISKGGYFSLVGKEGGNLIPPEVQAVLDRMTALTQIETDAITKFVTAELNANNWSKTDEFFSFGLSGTNNLTGFKSKTATETDVDFEIRGADLDGATGFLDTLFNPNTEGIALADNRVSIFTMEESDSIANAGVWAAGTSWRQRINAYRGNFMGNTQTALGFSAIEGGHLMEMGVNGAGVVRAYENGVQVLDGITIQTTVPNANLLIGVTAATFFTGIISAIGIGKEVGFNHPTHYQNLLTYLVELGTFSTPVIDLLVGATVPEQNAVRAFIDAEALVGNWQKTDQVMCFALAGLNSLRGWKGNTGFNNGATIDVNGATLNGTDQDVNANFTPDGDEIYSSLNDAYLEAFVKTAVAVTGNRAVLGANSGAGTRSSILNQPANNRTVFGINSAANNFNDLTAGDLNNTLVGVRRTAANQIALMRDGVVSRTGTTASNLVVNVPVHIGSFAGASYFEGTISMFFASANLPNYPAHNTNARAFLTALGTIP